MNNSVRNSSGHIIGFRCSQCSEIKDKMWGTTCNPCRDSNEQSKMLRAEIAQLNAALSQIVKERKTL